MLLHIESIPVFSKIAKRASASPLASTFNQLKMPMKSEGVIVPGEVLPCAAIGREGKPVFVPMKWGMSVPGKDAKTQIISGYYKKHRHCVVPVSFWSAETDYQERWIFRPNGLQIAWLAGIYEMENHIPCFSLVGINSGNVQELNLIPEDGITKWLEDKSTPPKFPVRILCQRI